MLAFLLGTAILAGLFILPWIIGRIFPDKYSQTFGDYYDAGLEILFSALMFAFIFGVLSIFAYLIGSAILE